LRFRRFFWYGPILILTMHQSKEENAQVKEGIDDKKKLKGSNGS
jgi:hypothetical protein